MSSGVLSRSIASLIEQHQLSLLIFSFPTHRENNVDKDLPIVEGVPWYAVPWRTFAAGNRKLWEAGRSVLIVRSCSFCGSYLPCCRSAVRHRPDGLHKIVLALLSISTFEVDQFGFTSPVHLFNHFMFTSHEFTSQSHLSRDILLCICLNVFIQVLIQVLKGRV